MPTTAYRAALDVLAQLACGLGSVGATVLVLTHPEAFDIHRHGLFLDTFAAIFGLALFLMLDRATDHLASVTWRRNDTEPCATYGEPITPALPWTAHLSADQRTEFTRDLALATTDPTTDLREQLLADVLDTWQRFANEAAQTGR